MTETWNKTTGIPCKYIARSKCRDKLIDYLDEYWGLQVSYCTGVARRVPLRKTVAQLTQHFLTGSDCVVAISIVEILSPNYFATEFKQLAPHVQTHVLEAIENAHHSLRHTGLDATENICVLLGLGVATNCAAYKFLSKEKALGQGFLPIPMTVRHSHTSQWSVSRRRLSSAVLWILSNFIEIRYFYLKHLSCVLRGCFPSKV